MYVFAQERSREVDDALVVVAVDDRDTSRSLVPDRDDSPVGSLDAGTRRPQGLEHARVGEYGGRAPGIHDHVVVVATRVVVVLEVPVRRAQRAFLGWTRWAGPRHERGDGRRDRTASELGRSSRGEPNGA